jgi:putative transposase
MKKHKKEFSIEKMAKVLGVSRSGYYDFLERPICSRAIENERLKGAIRRIHEKSRKTYGSPRVHNELKKQGESCSRRRVAKLMKEDGIEAKMRKKWKRTTCVDERLEPSANHLNQNFIASEPDKVWVSDITYVWTEEGWLYLAIVMDLFSRKIVGVCMGERLQTKLASNALKQAIFRRGIKEGLIHHSDRGSQYTSREFRELTDRHKIKLSMSGIGHCYDNAVAESFFHTLKTEHTNFCKYRIREEAKNSIFEYIEVFYNRQRTHSTIGYQTPEAFEKCWMDKTEDIA